MITVVKLATISSCYKIVIWKLNNIMINRLTNLQPSVLLDKWWFNTSQDWMVLRDNFDSVNLETIPYAILWALNFYHSLLDYLQEGALRFIDVTDKPKLVSKLEDNGQPIMDSKDKKARKGLKRAAKRKIRCYNICALVWQTLAINSIAPLLSCSPLPVLSSYLPVPALSSYPRLPSLLSSRLFMLALSSYLFVPVLSSLPMLTLSYLPILALLSFPVPISLSCFMLGLTPTRLISLALKTFKRALSNKLLGRWSTSLSFIESFYPF